MLSIFTGLLAPAYIAGYFWGDYMGGLLVAGVLRAVFTFHTFSLSNSLAHIYGYQPYSPFTSGKDNFLVSLLTFGEGYQNFAHEFPIDYRLGAGALQFDPVKWLLAILSVVGLVYNMKVTSRHDINRSKLQTQQRLLDRLKLAINFGPSETSLPVIDWATVKERVKAGDKLVVIDDFAHDVSEFMNVHPGGIPNLQTRFGLDATNAFNGGVTRHTKAARNILATLRVARVIKGKED